MTNSRRHQAAADLQALVDAGRGDVPLTTLPRLRGLGLFSIARPLSINGLPGEVCTTGGVVGRWRSAVGAAAAIRA
jgi:hypothetical protein